MISYTESNDYNSLLGMISHPGGDIKVEPVTIQGDWFSVGAKFDLSSEDFEKFQANFNNGNLRLWCFDGDNGLQTAIIAYNVIGQSFDINYLLIYETLTNSGKDLIKLKATINGSGSVTISEAF